MPRRSYHLVWSPTAERDLADIWNYLDQYASRTIADAQIRKINARCVALRRNPLAGRTRNDLLPSLRQVLIDPYIVFYRMNNGRVEVMHVLHGRRNLAAVFSGNT